MVLGQPTFLPAAPNSCLGCPTTSSGLAGEDESLLHPPTDSPILLPSPSTIASQTKNKSIFSLVSSHMFFS